MGAGKGLGVGWGGGFEGELFEEGFERSGEVGHFLLLVEQVGGDWVEVRVVEERGLLRVLL